MSHKAVIKTQFKDKKILLEALQKLGCQVRQDTMLSLYEGKYPVDIAFKVQLGRELSNENFGFKMENGAMTYIGDLWMSKVTQPQLDSVMDQLRIEYSRMFVTQELAREGFMVSADTLNQKGEVELTLRRYA